MKKKFIAMLLASVMVLSMAACSNKKAVETKEPTEKENTVKTESTTGKENTAEKEVVEPTVEPLKEITYWTNNMGDNEEAVKKLCALFEEQTGVKLTITMFPIEDYEDALMAALLSCNESDLPDLIEAPTNIAPLVRQNLLMDMSSYLKDNEALTALNNRNPALTNGYTDSKGGVYALSSSNFQTMCIWVREDIQKELGIKDPVSLDEFTDMLRAFKKAYPDMIPLTGPASMYRWETISSLFGVKCQIAEKNGKFVDFTLTNEFKEFMDYMKMLYDEGLLDKELPTNTSMSRVRTKFSSGAAICDVVWDNTYRTFTNGLKENNISGEVGYLEPFETEDGAFGLEYTAANGPICITIGAGERAKQIFDTFFTWYFTEESGIMATSLGFEGFNYNVVNGVYEVNPDVSVSQCGQSNPPVDPDFKYPFDFDEVNQKRYEINKYLSNRALEIGEKVTLKIPGFEYNDYLTIQSDLDAKRTELYYLYLTSQIDYDKFCTDYQKIIDELGVPAMLEAMNK